MRLLIITQKVDRNDPVLGFFHRWLEVFATKFESLIVICLEEGEHHLPPNVKVLSLGKEKSVSKLTYLRRFYTYIWRERKNYDAVFVHMNQEYVLLAGDIWRALGKKIYLWRNHAYGNALTNVAVTMAHKVFCTSPSSYTARFKKTKLMPVGIDTDFFKPDPNVRRERGSVLFLGRLSPVKKVKEFLAWLATTSYRATVAGPADDAYGQSIVKALPSQATYIGSVTQEGALRLYQSHEIYANFTEAGSFDKTILEAAASECRLVLRNADLRYLEAKSGPELRDFVVQHHSLQLLADRLHDEIH